MARQDPLTHPGPVRPSGRPGHPVPDPEPGRPPEAAQDALATLEGIERGERGLTVLPFLALMKGSGKPAFIKRWKRAVETDPRLDRPGT